MREPEYFQEYKNIKSLGSEKQLTWSGKRKKLTEKYGWTIPNEQIINYLVTESTNEPIFEIGAGNGYLSYEIQKNGGQTIPIDISTTKDTWVPVKEMSYEELKPEETSKIILPWPPANSSMGEKCIQYLNPDVIYFIGKKDSNITGSKELHKLFEMKYECKYSCELPSWTDNETTFNKYVI